MKLESATLKPGSLEDSVSRENKKSKIIRAKCRKKIQLVEQWETIRMSPTPDKIIANCR
jgi:hypothetical protein